MKKLHRSKDNKIISGILGGVGEYFNVDPVLVRFIYILVMFATGLAPLVLAYLVAYFIIPKKHNK
ncbi:MAG: PspC domain-containing protein [Candidatus Paceibacterota bacterium]